jgi:hypothetical protein
MIASIVDWATLGKVAVYSLAAGIGIAAIFGLGVSSAAALLDSVREHRPAASVAWGALAVLCVGCALAIVVLGVVVMAEKG